MFALPKIARIFAVFLQGTIFLNLVCTAFFIAVSSADYAATIKGYHSDGCCALSSVIVPCRTEKGSLSSFINHNLNFSFMQGTMKNEGSANHSSTSRTTHDTGISVFNFESGFNVRVCANNGNPLFCLSDVCHVLGIQNPSYVKERLNPKGVSLKETLTKGGKQSLLFISEGNLYKVVIRSDKPNARKFEDWVTEEILPTIRKTGIFSTTPLPYLQFSDCITLTCTDVGGQTRRMYLYYNVSDDWFQATTVDCANLIQGYMKQLAGMDKKVVAIKTEWLRLRNGKYEPSTIMFPAWEKETEKQADPIAQCERAISDYNRARARVKEAAGNVVSHIYSTSKS
jgi:prophage antirepressor-like protein